MEPWRFSLLGFNVKVLPGFVLLIGVYGLFSLQAQRPMWTVAVFGVVVFGSILVHELGHALMARQLKLRVGDIRLHGFGGDVTHARGGPKRDLLVSLAGPSAGLLLGGLVWVASPWLPSSMVLDQFVRDLLFVNIIWSLFNLLPLWPLDGGNVLGNGLAIWLKPRNAWRLTHGMGLLVGVGLSMVAFQWGSLILLFVAGQAAYNNWQQLRAAPV